MLAQVYAQALVGLGERADNERLIGVLKAKGHYALLPSIVREYEKLLDRKNREASGMVSVAQEQDIERLRKEIKTAADHLEVSLPNARVVLDETLVGGFVLGKGEKEVDASYKTQLLTLYRRLMGVKA